MMKKETRRSRIILLIITALFALPFASAWLLNFYFPELRPEGHTNHGQLVLPQREIPVIAMLQNDGTTLDPNYLKGEWTLLYIGGAQCAQMCRENLYKIRQIRLAQGKNFDRIHRLLVISGGTPHASHLEAKEHYPGLDMVSLPDPMRTEWLTHFRLNDNEDVRGMERIYLIDPLGHLMMSYEAGADPKGIIKDLGRLLRASYIG